MKTKPDYFLVLPGFTVITREYDKDIISGEQVYFDIAKITPVRINMADVAAIASPSYTDPSSLYYKSKDEPYLQKNMCSVRVNTPGDFLTYWLAITYDEFSLIHDEYLKKFGIQDEVPNYYTKP